jgi:PAS domain S-box-containing protein
MALDLNATGAAEPLPTTSPGSPGRELHERQAALARGHSREGQPTAPLCAPDVPGLNPDLVYTLVAENVRDYAIFLLDPNGIIRCWGEGARLMKWWTREQAEGSHLRFLYPDGGAEDGVAEDHLRQAAECGEYTGEGHRVRSDSSLFWAYVTLTALRDPDGRLVGFSKVTRDFTARRAVEAAIRVRAHAPPDAQRLLDEANRQKLLVASISHEVRAPLNALLGYVSLLEAEVGGPERRQLHLSRVKQNAEHLLAIISDILDFSRAQSGSLAMTAAVHRLRTAVQDAIGSVEATATARGVSLVNAVSGAAGDLPYLGDEGRVRQILVNLVSNAIKFTDAGGQITVSGGTGETVQSAELSGSGPWIYIRVEDTGRGIPADRIATIFEPFEQSQTEDQQRGTGLGLSISRQLARLMGGDITVRSQVGSGSTFTLWLPIASTEEVPR